MSFQEVVELCALVSDSPAWIPSAPVFCRSVACSFSLSLSLSACLFLSSVSSLLWFAVTLQISDVIRPVVREDAACCADELFVFWAFALSALVFNVLSVALSLIACLFVSFLGVSCSLSFSRVSLLSHSFFALRSFFKFQASFPVFECEE